jgi:hypothetical protein
LHLLIAVWLLGRRLSVCCHLYYWM